MSEGNLFIRNEGQGLATNVKVVASTFLAGDVTLQGLPSRQELSYATVPAIGDPNPAEITVTWTDNRDGEQQKVVPISW